MASNHAYSRLPRPSSSESSSTLFLAGMNSDTTPIESVNGVDNESDSCIPFAGEQGESEGDSTHNFSTPTSYICRGYDPNAPHFDGLAEARNEDYLIDLDTDSMERLPDVRAFLFYIGYDTVHKLRASEPMGPLEREQEYVTAGRSALKAERDAGRGLFLAPKDWASVRTEGDPWPWFETVLDITEGQPGDGQAEGQTGVWHVAYFRYDWNMPHASYAATNVRAPLLPKKDMLIGPGHPDWTRLIIGQYEDHPLGLLNMSAMERMSHILGPRFEPWYTPETTEYFDHHVDDHHSDIPGCSYCQAESDVH